MDKCYVKSVIDGLKSPSSSKVHECLTKIRNKIISNDEGIALFRELGGLEHLLPHIRKPNERILDLTLSILGNCCLEHESSLLVGKSNVYSPLVNIINTVCRDSIVGRTCRVIGNLAQKSVNAEGLYSSGALSALIALIEQRDKKTSYPTLTMAVRAIRQLWMLTEKRDEMLLTNIVRCIAMLLTTECETAGVIKTTSNTKETDSFSNSQEELISGILKCIGYFTTHATVQCAEQMQGDGRGYQCLVALMKTHESLALKCLMNLCYISAYRPHLGTAGFVESLVAILSKISDVTWWPEGAARALAQLSGEAVNRARLKHANGLPLLLAAARHNSHAMHALLQYVFDDSSFQILLSEGLITFLTEELTDYLKTMEYEHSHVDANENTTDEEVKTEEQVKPAVFTTQEDNTVNIKKAVDLPKNEDELKVVIERDNMIVGFVDAVDSDASDSQSEDEEVQVKRKGLKRSRSESPKQTRKNSQLLLVKMASKVWSSGVYWVPKSPEVPTFRNRPQSPEYESQSPDGQFSPFSKRGRWDWSPESGFSTGEGSSASPPWTDYQWSPGSSPRSPYSNNEESSDSDMSGRYSPVCSDNDDGEPLAESAAEIDAAQVANHLDDLVMEDDESVDAEYLEDETQIVQNSKSSRIACVLVLLFRVSHGAWTGSSNQEESSPHSALESLTKKECLNALLDYVERCKRPLGRAARIFARVLSNSQCLLNALKHRIILRLYQMSINPKHPPAKCQQCKQILKLSTKLMGQLTILAESHYGIGVISYQLYKGSSSIKHTLSLTLPYIVRCRRDLKKYFFDCNAMQTLLKVVSDTNEDIEIGVVALSKLATNAQIKDPKLLEKRFKEHINVSYDPILDNLEQEDIVTFELDDLTTVRANKVFLCQNSDVFSAMLLGCFKESIEKCVRLKNITKQGLEYLLTLLHFGLNNTNSDVQVFPLDKNLETNLEVLLLADRFLFDNLKSLLCSAILQFQLTPDTADRIYSWSLSDGMGVLCVESVAYILTGQMCDSERVGAFSKIMNLKYKDQWLDDIQSMISRQLHPFSRCHIKDV